jgi:hypothetical protein
VFSKDIINAEITIWYGKNVMNKTKKEILRKFRKKNFAKSKKIRTFANDSEPSALATDVGKVIPTLTGESARRFLENARKVEIEAEKRRNEPPSLEWLEKELAFNKFFLDQDIDNVKTRYKRICELEDKIKEIKEKNGKTEEE